MKTLGSHSTLTQPVWVVVELWVTVLSECSVFSAGLLLNHAVWLVNKSEHPIKQVMVSQGVFFKEKINHTAWVTSHPVKNVLCSYSVITHPVECVLHAGNMITHGWLLYWVV